MKQFNSIFMALLPDEFRAYTVLLLIFLLFFSIYKGLIKPAFGFVLVVTVFIILGILTPKEALMGFSNVSIATIALLIVLSGAIRRNFKIEKLFDNIFLNTKSYNKFLLLMMGKVALFSSFINNTPVVTIMTPYVYNWGKKNNISPSKLLIPLSYSTILGGMITTIGTSTTLILIGLISDQNMAPIPLQYFVIIGSSVTITGILFMITVGKKLLPNNTDMLSNFTENKREYLIERRLQPNSPLIGQTVKQGGLRNLKNVYLVEIIRGRDIISPVPPNLKIESSDILIFAGNTEQIMDLTSSDLGITLPASSSYEQLPELQVVETVISTNSFLGGKTIKSANFRARFDAAVVAIHRNGEKLSGKLGSITLKAGDVLLLYTGTSFKERIETHKDLFIITGNSSDTITHQNQPYWLLAFSMVSFLLIPLGFSNLFTSLLMIFCYMFFRKMITMKNLKRDLDINVFVIMAFSITMGNAMISSGAGDMVGGLLLGFTQQLGTFGILIGLAILTALLTSFISNVGAISIIYPIALSISHSMQINYIPVMLVIAFAASSAFITPIGYQTNLIVYGPGGYTFKDFAKVGIPITVIYLVTVLALIYLLFPSMVA